MPKVGMAANAPPSLTEFARLVTKNGRFEPGLVLYAADTPNTHKVAMLLEELAVPYQVVPINIAKNEQKEPWFTAICPNGRTPAMVDLSDPEQPFALFESGAILLYLCDKYGSELLPRDARGRSEVEQWLMWQMSALGPMLGNCMYFKRIAAPMAESIEHLQFGIDRYHNESIRLLGILDERMADREYLCGPGRGVFSVADIACFSYANSHWWAGIDVSRMTSLAAWLARIAERSTTSAGFSVPSGKDKAGVATFSESMQRRIEENATAAGRPYFGWRDVAELGGRPVGGALLPPIPKL